MISPIEAKRQQRRADLEEFVKFLISLKNMDSWKEDIDARWVKIKQYKQELEETK